MKITVKATGLYSRALPEERTGNTAALDVRDGATAIDVLAQLGLAADGSYLMVLNGQTLPKSERGGRVLSEGDNLAIMPPLKGG